MKVDISVESPESSAMDLGFMPNPISLAREVVPLVRGCDSGCCSMSHLSPSGCRWSKTTCPYATPRHVHLDRGVLHDVVVWCCLAVFGWPMTRVG
jgi:hypothetical protein